MRNQRSVSGPGNIFFLNDNDRTKDKNHMYLFYQVMTKKMNRQENLIADLISRVKVELPSDVSDVPKNDESKKVNVIVK